MMGKYTYQQVEAVADNLFYIGDDQSNREGADMLYAYASLLDQIERAREGVTRTIQEAIECLGDVAQYKGNLKVGVYRHIVQKLHDLLAVAHLLPSERGGVDRLVAIRLAQYGAEYAYRHKGLSFDPLQDGCEERIDGWIKQAGSVARPPAQAAQAEDSLTQDGEAQSYVDADGCPTETEVLKRFWREHHQPTTDPIGVPDWIVLDGPQHGDDAGDGLLYILCKVGFGDHLKNWLLIPHADGQYVTAAKLVPFSMEILKHQLAAPTVPQGTQKEGGE